MSEPANQANTQDEPENHASNREIVGEPVLESNCKPARDPNLAPDTRGRPAHEDTWQALRRYTPARIALGRYGASLPTPEVLGFSMEHARARDAVHLALDTAALAASLEQAGFATMTVHSQAADRSTYLRRPDLGRRLDPAFRPALLAGQPLPHRLAVVVADGLSSLAPARHALPLLVELRTQLAGHADPVASAWLLDTIVIATNGRVALADEVGELRRAEAAIMLIGERPGLSSPDSLGIYITYAPRPGRSDAERNCLSNIRREGLSYSEAVYKLLFLLNQARQAGESGVAIKDMSVWTPPGRSLPGPT